MTKIPVIISNSDTFGKRFKLLRIQKELTQEEFIKDFNIKFNCQLSAAAVSRYENGKRLPELDTLIAIANYFDVSLDYLVCRTDDPQISIIYRNELPKEIADLGVDYIEVMKEAKEKGLSSKTIQEIVEFAQKINKPDQ